MNKERPILWSAPMVLALLAGRKTQTRRLLKPQPNEGGYMDNLGDGESLIVNGDVVKPYARVGDRLWGRETHAVSDRHIAYRADGNVLTRVDNGGEWEKWHGGYVMGFAKHDKTGNWVTLAKFGGKWKPSISMSRWASRLLHEVTAVRVERLQDITEADAKAEGVEPFPYDPGGDCWTDGTYRTAYNYLWNEINGWSPDSWAANPWVWVVSFQPVTMASP